MLRAVRRVRGTAAARLRSRQRVDGRAEQHRREEHQAPSSWKRHFVRLVRWSYQAIAPPPRETTFGFLGRDLCCKQIDERVLNDKQPQGATNRLSRAMFLPGVALHVSALGRSRCTPQSVGTTTPLPAKGPCSSSGGFGVTPRLPWRSTPSQQRAASKSCRRHASASCCVTSAACWMLPTAPGEREQQQQAQEAALVQPARRAGMLAALHGALSPIVHDLALEFLLSIDTARIKITGRSPRSNP
jgi:hypothetical protein